MPERIMDGGDILVEVLNSHNVEYIIASPGSEWPPLWEALCRRQAEGEKTPTYIGCRHEALAVGAATGYHRATGKLPAVILHATVGSINCATALQAALHDGTPMLVCAGESIGYGEMEGQDPGSQWGAGGLGEIGGPARLVAPYTKWSTMVHTTVTLADTIHRACEIAMASPRGPVFVGLPLELMLQKIPVDHLPTPPALAGTPRVDGAVLEEAARLLIEARHPVVYTGSAGKDPEAMGQLVELAEMLALPVVETPAPEVTNFPTDNPLHQGYSPRPLLNEADVVLLLASVTPWHPPSQGPGPDCKVIDFSPDPERRLKPYSGYPCHISVRGEVGPNLKALTRAVRDLKPRSNARAALYDERAARLHQEHRQRMDKLQEDALASKDASPVDPHWLGYALNEALPDDAIIVHEMIVHRRIVDSYWERRHPGGYMKSYGGLGQGLSNALGMKLAHPDRLVVAALGDGAFNYNPVPSCYGLCQQYGMPILTVIFNNGGYSSQQGSLNTMYPGGFGEKAGKEMITGIAPRPDYPKLVEAFGGWGEAVNRPEEVAPAIKRGIQAVKEGKPALVDVLLSW